MFGIVGTDILEDAWAEQLGVLPLQATPPPPSGANLVIWNTVGDLFNFISVD